MGDLDIVVQPEDITHPNFNLMGEDEIKTILNQMKWEEFYIKELLEARDKNIKFRESNFWHKFVKAQKSMADFHNYLWYNTIFLSAELHNEFKKMDTLIYDSIKNIEDSKRIAEDELREIAFKRIREEAKEYVTNLEKMIQKKLHFDEAT